MYVSVRTGCKYTEYFAKQNVWHLVWLSTICLYTIPLHLQPTTIRFISVSILLNESFSVLLTQVPCHLFRLNHSVLENTLIPLVFPKQLVFIKYWILVLPPASPPHQSILETDQIFNHYSLIYRCWLTFQIRLSIHPVFYTGFGFNF